MARLPGNWAGIGQRIGAPALRPSVTGLGALLLVGVLLLMAVNEANNLLYALAFLMAALWLCDGVLAWHNLQGLRLQWLQPDPVFAGQPAMWHWQLRGGLRARHGLHLAWAAVAPTADAADAAGSDGGPAALLLQAVPAGADPACALPLASTGRGWQDAPVLRVRSLYPLGLWQATRVFAGGPRRLVWPQPLSKAAAPASAGSSAPADHTFTGLSPWRVGDSPRRMAWRAMARDEQPRVKRFDGERGAQCPPLRWQDTRGDTETRLSMLVRWLLDADASGQPWVLEMPGHAPLRADLGAPCLRQALGRLALWPGLASAPDKPGAAAS